MQNFKDLHVWRKAHQLTLAIYKHTKTFPIEERYALTSQIRRCCSSIPSNIAEGCGRGSNADLGRFLHIAMGSASELEYQLLLAKDLTYLDLSDYDALNAAVEEVRRMLAALIKTVKAKS